MKKQKLLISAITLVFAVIAVVSSTYAWFTMNSVNTVSDLDFTATSGDGLYMSLLNTDGSWKTELSIEDFKAAGQTAKYFEKDANDNPKFKLSPVTLLSSNFAKDDNNLITKSKLVGYGESGIVDATVSEYVQFTIYFRSPVKMNVYLEDLNVTSTGNKTIILKDATETFWQNVGTAVSDSSTNDRSLSTNLANAARVMISGNNGSQMIDPQSSFGFGPIANSYDASVSHQYLRKVSNSTAKMVEKAFDTVDDSGTVTQQGISKVYNSYSAFNKIDSMVLLAQSGDYFVGQMTITLWIEGFDSDCFDVLLGDALKFNIKFKGAAA